MTSVGTKRHRLTVTGYSDRIDHEGKPYLRCLCDCGNTHIVSRSNFGHGCKSCGCLALECVAERSTVHGHARPGKITTTYRSWTSMKRRCNAPNNQNYRYYGARGIKVCARWTVFENFLKDMGERPDDTSLDRKDSNGNYEPENCRWANSATQAKNKRPRRSVK